MLTYKEWLQIILDNGSIVHNGERYPAHEIYTVDMLDAQSHEYFYPCYLDNVSASVFDVQPMGETWGIA